MKLLQDLLETVADKIANKQKEITLNKPGGFNVCILNDPVTPGMLVIEAVVKVIGINQAEAMKRVMAAHTNGWVVIATYAQEDVAEMKAELLMNCVKGNTSHDWTRKISGHKGEWPFTVEVMKAGE